MEKERFSFYRAPIQNVKPCREAGLEDIVRYLVSDFALERTERVRRATGEERRRAKGERLDFVTFSGVFETRHKEAIVEHSGLICMDLDHIGDEEEVREVEEYLSDDPILGATLMFRSPSGDGLKVVVRVGRRAVASDSDQTARHKELYEMIALYLKTIYELESDKTSDAARACFLCHDPAPYYNPTARCDRRAIIRRIDREIAMKRGSVWVWLGRWRGLWRPFGWV